MKDRIRELMTTSLLTGGISLLFYSYLHYSEKGYLPASDQLEGYILAGVIGLITGIVIHFLNRVLEKFFPWQGGFTTRFMAGFVVYLAVSFGLTFLLSSFVVSFIGGEVFWKGFATSDEDLLWKLFILLLVGSFIYSVIYSLLFSYKQYAVTQINILQNERKQLELQFEALKSQLSPHFLFNSLNTISSLLYSDPQTAEQFVRRLVQTYQYILSTQNKKYVSLQEELDFIQSYYYLLRIRFQQFLSVDINVPRSIINSPIPPLTLQLLVENAVKHNTISKDEPLSITISAIDNKHLKVINTKTSVNESPSFKVGLENIKKRYHFFTDRLIEVRDEKDFTVLLPVISQKDYKTVPAL